MRSLSKFTFLSSEIWKNISLSKKKLFYIYILLSLTIAVIDFLSITSLMNIVGYATGNEIISKDKINFLINISEYSDKNLFPLHQKFVDYFNNKELLSPKSVSLKIYKIIENSDNFSSTIVSLRDF